ncbi:MAG: peptidoglycan-binding protein [Defluviitaleaceae bacterium]|nr:peptidoglycan-binding protein [Defluviitaleaceae bacterium]MCL2835784.1 peptidoglycan-binding protein [Defluviitaleaceae bacterium]
MEITNKTTVAMLQEYAAKNNIDLQGKTRRQDIVDVIQAATASQNKPTSDESAGGGANTQPEAENATGDAESVTGDGEAGAIVIETPENVIDPTENDHNDGENVITRLLQASRLLMQGDDVQAVHARLEEKGINVGTDKAEGIYGAKTAYAVRLFQARNGLIVDGKVGKFTATALGFTWQGGAL